MSDCGVIIKFSKKQGSIGESDLNDISEALKQVISNSENYPSNILEGNYLPLREWDKNVYVSLITEYYLDEDEDELRQWAEEEDIDQALDIIENLKSIIDNIEMSAHIEDW